MKKTFTADRKAFGDAVAWVARWVPSKPSVPVWAGLLMEARDGQLTLCGYDEDVSARATVPIEGDATGTVLVSGRLLAALVASFPAKHPVQAEADDSILTLTAARVVVTLPLMGASEYPTLPVAPPAVATMEGRALATAIGRVAPASTGDPSQGVWTSLRLSFTSGRMEALASDTRRVAQVFAAAGTDTATEIEALIPAPVVVEAVKMMTTADQVEIGVSGNLVSFAVPGRTLTVRQSAGPYKTKQVRAVVAADPPVAALVPVIELLPAVDRAMILKAEGHPTVLEFTAGEVAISAKGGEAGSRAAETLDIEYDGPDCRLAVNPSYLTDALGGVDGGTARIAFDPDRPAKALLITDPDDPDYRHVMVPIKLTEPAPTKTHKRDQPESMD